MIRSYDAQRLPARDIRKQVERDNDQAKNLGFDLHSSVWNGQMLVLQWRRSAGSLEATHVKTYEPSGSSDTARILTRDGESAEELDNGQRPSTPANRKQMGKLQELGQRFTATKKKLYDEADKLAAGLDDLDKQSPGVFDLGHNFIATTKTEIDAMDSEFRQLANDLNKLGNS